MNTKTRNVFLAALAVIAVLGIGLIALVTLNSRPAVSTEARSFKYRLGNEERSVVGEPVNLDASQGARFSRGEAGAKVTITEFSDYQCPACGVFANNVENDLMARLVASGKARFVYRDFPLEGLHPNARAAALAVACADDQRRWEAMHAALFRAQPQWSSGQGDAALRQLVDIAGQLGMDRKALETCVTSDRHRAAIDADIAAGRAVGIGATPTFVVSTEAGSYRFEGVLPVEAFEAILAELAP